MKKAKRTYVTVFHVHTNDLSPFKEKIQSTALGANRVYVLFGQISNNAWTGMIRYKLKQHTYVTTEWLQRIFQDKVSFALEKQQWTSVRAIKHILRITKKDPSKLLEIGIRPCPGNKKSKQSKPQPALPSMKLNLVDCRKRKLANEGIVEQIAKRPKIIEKPQAKDNAETFEQHIQEECSKARPRDEHNQERNKVNKLIKHSEKEPTPEYINALNSFFSVHPWPHIISDDKSPISESESDSESDS